MLFDSEQLLSMEDLFKHELFDLYSAEKQIIKALPKMIKNTSNSKLKKGLEKHLKVTEEQKARLEKIATDLDIDMKNVTCKGMEGVITEGEEIMKMKAEPEVLDAGLIIAAQRVEHYEMAGYGSAAAHAKVLGYKDAAKLLHKTLLEEESADKELSTLAETKINKVTN